jgi:aspartyl-tRNA(Asn)/glutamyl-tRNA(Gln) amidotransferase subunit C
MSALTHEDVTRIAELARLALTDDERELFRRQLAEILTYMEQIAAVDTTGVPPTSHVQHERTVLRDDVVKPSLSRDEALANAPDARREAGLFRVPKVIG